MNYARKVFNLKFESKIFEYEETIYVSRCNKYYFIFPRMTRLGFIITIILRISGSLFSYQKFSFTQIVEYSSNILRVETDGSHHHICAVGNKICPCTMAWATHSDRKTWLHLWYHKTYIRSLSENIQPTSARQVLVSPASLLENNYLKDVLFRLCCFAYKLYMISNDTTFGYQKIIHYCTW